MTRRVRVIVSAYDKIPYPVTVLREIPGQGFEIEYDIPEKQLSKPQDLSERELLELIARDRGLIE